MGDESGSLIPDDCDLIPELEPSKKRKWTEEEDELLRSAIGSSHRPKWKEVAHIVGTRNESQCAQRWKKILCPGIVRGPWSEQEDAMLVDLVGQGFRNWGQLAKHMPGRTHKQCRERWTHHLDPSIVKTEFSAEEDRLLLCLHSQLGGRWADISRCFQGRTEDSVRCRFKALLVAEKAHRPPTHRHRITRNAVTILEASEQTLPLLEVSIPISLQRD